MSAEIGVVLAHLTNRILVLEGNISPPANVVEYEEYGISNRDPSRITDLIEIPVPWLEYENVDFSSLDTFVMSQKKLMDSVFYWPPSLDIGTSDFESFARGRTDFVTLTEAGRVADVLRPSAPTADGHALENLGFYSYYFYLDEPSRRSAHDVLRRMGPKPPYRRFADRLVGEIGDFNAVHVRRGDFKKTFGVTTRDRTPREVIDALDRHFDRDQTLVILTDERNDPFFEDIVDHYRHTLFIDHFILENHRDEFVRLPHHDSMALAYLSQLVAAQSRDFVGSMTSTYTSMIQRLRGNRGSYEPFKFLWNEIPEEGYAVTERGSHPASDCVPLRDGVMLEEFEGPYSWNRYNRRINPAWMREWPESFLYDGSAGDTVSSRDDGSAEGETAPTERANAVSDEGLQEEPRRVDVRVHLAGGHTCRTTLSSDSELLRDLFLALAANLGGPGSAAPKFFQLPLNDGEAAYSFTSEHLVAIATEPPVLVSEETSETADAELDRGASVASATAAATHETHPPRPREPARAGPESPVIRIHDFLTPDEHRLLLDYALLHEAGFDLDEKSGYRNAAVAPAFRDSVLADIFANRLRLLLPQILPSFDIARVSGAFALRLTAHRDGDELSREAAADVMATEDEITCAYYFHRKPRPHFGGELRFLEESGEVARGIEPGNNMLLVHPTRALQQVLPLRCPAGSFADSRFAITARISLEPERRARPPSRQGTGRSPSGPDPFVATTRTLAN